MIETLQKSDKPQASFQNAGDKLGEFTYDRDGKQLQTWPLNVSCRIHHRVRCSHSRVVCFAESAGQAVPLHEARRPQQLWQCQLHLHLPLPRARQQGLPVCFRRNSLTIVRTARRRARNEAPKCRTFDYFVLVCVIMRCFARIFEW